MKFKIVVERLYQRDVMIVETDLEKEDLEVLLESKTAEWKIVDMDDPIGEL
jgi:hypothetical protein